MDTRILKHLLNNAFYSANKHKLSSSLFEDEIQELYEVIQEAHDKYSKDIGGPDLFALWKIKNPVAVRAKIAVIEDLIRHIEAEAPYVDEVAADVIANLWQREHGRKIAEAGLAISEGKPNAFNELQTLLAQTKDGFMPDDFGPETTKDLEELLLLSDDENRWRFNITALSKHVYGMGPGEFGAIFARPETGKTSLGVSLSVAAGGFCHQGAKVFIGGNEEDTKRTMMRAYQASSAMDRDWIAKDPHRALEAFNVIRDKITMRNVMNWSIYDLDAFLDKEHFDVVIIDQLDKLKVVDRDLEGYAKLREIYLQAREIAKRRECALIGMSQASFDADDKTILTPDMMEGSKTGKFAELDLIIGIGKYKQVTEEDNDPTRYLTVGKNKLTGWHGTITCKLDAPTARYLD
jgi:hypothetical protein